MHHQIERRRRVEKRTSDTFSFRTGIKGSLYSFLLFFRWLSFMVIDFSTESTASSLVNFFTSHEQSEGKSSTWTLREKRLRKRERGRELKNERRVIQAKHYNSSQSEKSHKSHWFMREKRRGRENWVRDLRLESPLGSWERKGSLQTDLVLVKS